MKKALPYPRMCPACCKRTLEPATIHHVAEIKYESRTYKVEIPDLKVGKCPCGEVVFDLDTDVQIDTAFRTQAKLLTAAQIATARKRLRLKQGDLAKALGVNKATVSRWETRTLIQSRANDKALRAYFHDPHVRDLMDQIDTDPTIGVVEPAGDPPPESVYVGGQDDAADEWDQPPPLPVNRLTEVFTYVESQRGMLAFAATLKQRGALLT